MNRAVSANGASPLTRTGIQLEQDQKRQAILDEVLRLRPDTELEVGKYTTDLVYYTASVVKGKVVVSRSTRGIYLSCDPAKLVKYFYRTKLEAQQAIEAELPKAREHFKTCLTAHRELTARLGFAVGYNYDGDVHGIYNEYSYLSFICNGCRNPDSIVVAVTPVKLPDYVLKALRTYLVDRIPWTLIFHDMKLTAKQQREVLDAYKDPANRATARDYSP